MTKCITIMTDQEQYRSRIVKALYTFKGSNNDELNFTKGDIITITQKVEGGWWEGTLNGTTGWFPSNYVKETRQEDLSTAVQNGGEQMDLPVKRESQMHYRSVVLQSLIESERKLVNELETFLTSFLHPLNGANIISPKDYSILLSNLEDIVSFHQSILSSLEECARSPLHLQRVGGIFLKVVPQVKQLYKVYFSSHPAAAHVIADKKDELSSYMETKGATSPGHMSLTMNLSQPIGGLEKYPSVLKELERHTEESHIDRGDTQRAVSVYKELCVTCNEIRREKEIEVEIVNSPISGWEGEEISQLGEVLLMSHVKVLSSDGESKEQIFLGFKNVLVMLMVSPGRNSYVYEGKLPLSGLTVTKLEDTEDHSDALEIGGPLIEKRIVYCADSADQKKLLDGLNSLASPIASVCSSSEQSIQITKSQPSISTVTQAKTAKVTKSRPVYPITDTMWSMSCLRPAPPIRPSLLRGDPKQSPMAGRRTWGSRRKPVDDYRTLEDDAQLLKVIESYCTSAKARQTVNSLDLSKVRLTFSDTASTTSQSNLQLIGSPEFDDYGPLQGSLIRGFCCANLPMAKGFARTLKRF